MQCDLADKDAEIEQLRAENRRLSMQAQPAVSPDSQQQALLRPSASIAKPSTQVQPSVAEHGLRINVINKQKSLQQPIESKTGQLLVCNSSSCLCFPVEVIAVCTF